MDTSLRFLLTSFGSAGDLMPLLGLGQTLRKRGHEVAVLTGGGFGDLVARSGLDHVPLTPPAFYERSLRDFYLLGTRYHGLYVKRYAVTWNAELLRFASDATPSGTVMLSAERPLIWADLCAHLHYGLSCARVVVDLPAAPGLPAKDGQSGAPFQARLKAEWQASWSREVQPLKIGGGPRHVTRLFQASNRSVPRLAVWPDWMAPDAPRPAYLKTFGFVGGPTLDESPGYARSAAGRRLLVFVAGTVGMTAQWEQRFAEVSRKMCERLDCDGLMLGGTPPGGAADWPGFAWRKHLPLDAVLPQAAAIIHHGGVGTSAAALQHRVPQLIVPRMFSQPSNAKWFCRTGAALELPPEDYSPDAGVRQVERLLTDRAIHDASRACAAKIDPAAERDRLCSFVEEWHRRRIDFIARQQAREPLRATA